LLLSARTRRPTLSKLAICSVSSLLVAVGAAACGSSGQAASPGSAAAVKSSYTAADLPSLVAAAKKEGTLNLTIAPEWAPALIAGFKKAYPWAAVNVTQLEPPDAFAKWSAQASAGVHQIDVGGLLATAIAPLSQLGALAKVQVPNDALIPASLRDPGGYGHAIELEPIVILYNTKLTTSPPKELSQLADPQWRDKLIIDNPTLGGTSALALAGQRPALGSAAWDKLLAGIAANKPYMTTDASDSYAAMLRGDRPICICSYSDYASQKPGTPVGVDYYDQNANGIVASPIMLAVGAKSPHPAMAALFLNWMLSPTGGQKVFISIPRTPAVPVPGNHPIALPSTVKIVPLFATLGNYLKDPTGYTDEYKKYFG
jgi:ABC-type Fe3+ transport system substrate-binding protein